MPGFRKLPVWDYYQEVDGDYTKVRCLVQGCDKVISRGKTGAKRSKCNSNNMNKHTEAKHPEIWRQIKEVEEAVSKKEKEAKERERLKNETEKGGNQVWHLNSKVARWRFFQRVGHLYIVIHWVSQYTCRPSPRL